MSLGSGGAGGCLGVQGVEYGGAGGCLGVKWVGSGGAVGYLGVSRLNLGVLRLNLGVLGLSAGVLGLSLGLLRQVKGWGVGCRGVGDEFGGLGGHIPMQNAESLKNSEIWPKIRSYLQTYSPMGVLANYP